MICKVSISNIQHHWFNKIRRVTYIGHNLRVSTGFQENTNAVSVAFLSGLDERRQSALRMRMFEESKK